MGGSTGRGRPRRRPVGTLDTKRFSHPQLGALELHCQRLLDPQQSHALLVYTAVPGSESYDKLQLLSVIGPQAVRPDL
jgi:hypothetical protein